MTRHRHDRADRRDCAATVVVLAAAVAGLALLTLLAAGLTGYPR